MARILVIDDDFHMRSVIKQMLEKKGHQVVSEENGDLGINRYRKEGFDLVITDIVMPDKEGLETIQELHKVDPDIKIIAISGGALKGPPQSYLELAKQFGASESIEKPFSWKQLIDTVNQVLES